MIKFSRGKKDINVNSITIKTSSSNSTSHESYHWSYIIYRRMPSIQQNDQSTFYQECRLNNNENMKLLSAALLQLQKITAYSFSHDYSAQNQLNSVTINVPRAKLSTTFRMHFDSRITEVNYRQIKKQIINWS